MKVLGYIAAFAVGAAVGVAGGYFFAKHRYEKEIADFKAEYRQRTTADALEKSKMNDELKAEILRRAEEARAQAAEEKEKEKAQDEKDVPQPSKEGIDMSRYKSYIDEHKYKPSEKPARPIRKEGEPFVIDQDDYDDPDYDNYDKDTEFTLWANGVVTDEVGDKMTEEEIEDTIGHRWKWYFEDNPNEDMCFVRNEEKQIDYVLVKDIHPYEEL